ncbi:hypothetical protein [Brevibacillus dissolubilis]|uniref:hypothetical protein n=1 Tax=Brevibacillus dissolubilis TaxID=1844116 RepID=UPI0011176996|nr:hypothetical protein [Brevibacillus dissolubilis]
MIMPLPVKFDGNEMFTLAVFLFLLGLFIYLPRRFFPALLIHLLLFNSFFGRSVDIVLAIPPFNIYDSFDTGKNDLFDFINYNGIYPLYGYMFFHFYDRFNRLRDWAHVLIWAVFSTTAEWVSVQFGVFTYIKWHILWSFLVYVVVYIIDILFYKWITKKLHYERKGVLRDVYE